MNDASARTTGERLRAITTRIEGDERLDAVAARLRAAAAPVAEGRLGPLLRGEWLGHALHPMLTDLPIGCWTSAGVLDLLGGRGARRSAQRLVGLGVATAVPTLASGASEWPGLRDPRARRVAAVHAVGNSVATLLYYRSWRARRRGHHLRGVAYGVAGAAGATAAGMLGGHLAFVRRAGTGVRDGVDPVVVPEVQVDTITERELTVVHLA